MHWPDRAPAVLENAIEIDRRSSLSPEETMGRYLAGEGQPVVVTDAQASWRAAKLWSLEYFKEHFASDSLIASDRAPLRAEDNPRMHTLRTTLGDFIDYMQQPHHYIAEQERDRPFMATHGVLLSTTRRCARTSAGPISCPTIFPWARPRPITRASITV